MQLPGKGFGVVLIDAVDVVDELRVGGLRRVARKRRFGSVHPPFGRLFVHVQRVGAQSHDDGFRRGRQAVPLMTPAPCRRDAPDAMPAARRRASLPNYSLRKNIFRSSERLKSRREYWNNPPG